jgi:SAM-dependent methyltransferase
MPIDPTAATGFAAGAEPYHRARPAYPDAAVRFIVERFAIGPHTRVVELGAGNGKFTSSLLSSGSRVVAVEPVADMRRGLAREVPGALALGGTAEEIPLAAGCAGVVAAAQAFHWFDGPRALDEIHRVLVPGGGLALVWNARDTSTPWVGELARIVDAFGDTIKRHETEQWTDVFEGEERFSPLERHAFPNPQEVDEAQVVDRVASTSFIATLSEQDRSRVLDRVRDLVRSHPDTHARDRFTFPHETRVYTCAKI